MERLLNKSGIFSLLILAISFLGCENDDEAGVLPQVVAGFTQTTIEGTGTVSFINVSENADSFEWNFGDGTTSTEVDPIKTFSEGTFTVTLFASNGAGATSTFTDELTIDLPDPPPAFDSGLLTNGDFENGVEPWVGNAANVQTEGGNSFNLANVEMAGQPFDVNLSQVLELTDGTNYTLTFTASSDRERVLRAGIGLNEEPFTNTTVDVTLTTEPQTFTLQLAANGFGSANSRVLFDMGAAVGTVVIDNVSLVEGGDGSDSNTGGGGGMATSPTMAAPAPTQDAANVTSVFSNAYTDIAGTNPRAFGNDGGAVFSEIQVTGDDVWSYADTNFVGLQNDTGFDARTNFSMDIWVAEDISFRAGLISFTSPSATREDVEVNLTGGQWTTIDVALADLVPSIGGEGALPDNPTINQIIFDVLGDGVEASIFVDNVFFYTDNGSGMATAPTMAAPAPTQDAANVTSVFSNAYTNVAGTNPRAFGNDPGAAFSEIQVAGDDVWSYADTNFVGLQNDTGFDARTNFSMDIWVAENISFRAGLISFTSPAATREDVEVNLTGGQWTTIDVALADLVPSIGGEGALPDNPTINQIIFDVLGDGVEADIFVDNVFFYTDNSGGGASGESPFCRTQIQAFGGDAGSDIFISVFNVDAQTMRIEIESADSDPVDGLVFPAGDWIPVPGISVSPAEVSPGVWAGEFFYGAGAPANVEFNILWSKVSFGGNWSMNSPGNLSTVPFDATCDTSGVGGSGSGCTIGSAPTGPASTLPVGFEDCVGFDSTFGGVTAVLADNPSATGINTSATVLRVDKPTTADFFGGFQNSAAFSTGQFNGNSITVTFQVYSNLNDITFRCELIANPTPNPDLGNPPPQFATLGSNDANTWVELSVTFTPNPGAETDYYNFLVIKPDDNQDDPNGSETNPPAADGTYYIDNITVQ